MPEQAETRASDKQVDGARASERSDVFISYSRRDEKFVRRLVEALAEQGRRCWVDWRDIRPSAEWMAEVNAAIDSTDAFVFVISADSVRSEICREELERAVADNKRILPVVARDVDAEEVPEPATRRNWIFFREEDDFEKSLERLLKALDTEPEWAAMHTRLLVRAVEWDGADRDSSFALRGRDLNAAERWLSESDEHKDPQPTRLHSEYVVASRHLATRAQRVRTAVLGVGLVIAVGLAILALVQRNRAEDEADVARSRELAATALLAQSTDPERGLALAVEAGRVADTAEADRALRRALESNYPRRIIEAESGALNDVSFDRTGRRLATAGDSGVVQVFESRTGRELQAIRTGGGRALSAQFSPKGDLIATATGRGNVELWHASDAARVRAFEGHRGQVPRLAFSPDGALIATAGSDGTARVWDVQTGRQVARFDGHVGPFVNSVAFSPDGRLVVSAGADETARVWEADSGEQRLKLSPPADVREAFEWNSASFSPSGSRIVTAGDDGLVRVWDAATGDLQVTITASEDLVYDAAFSPNGTRLITSSLDGAVRVWDTRGGGRDGSGTRRGVVTNELLSSAGDVVRASFDPSGNLVASAHVDGGARIWDATPNDATLTFTHHNRGVLGATFSPDGEAVATSDGGGVVAIWDPATGSIRRELDRHPPGYVWDVAFSPDGAHLATVSSDRSARVWDVDSGRRHATLRAHTGEVYGVAYSPAAPDLLVTAGADERAYVWREEADRPLRVFEGHDGPVLGVAFDGSGQRVVTASQDGTAQVWDPETAKRLVSLVGHIGFVNDASFSPDGARVVTAGADETARIWDAAGGEPILTLRGHTAEVSSAAFSADGARVVTGSADRTVRVWDSTTGAELDVLRGPSERIFRASFSPADATILAASFDETARLFECELCVGFADLLADASVAEGTLLAPDERARILEESSAP